VPCIIRYPIDGLGFGPAEDSCNIGNNWGKYPEMKLYAGTHVLQSSSTNASGIRVQPHPFGSMRLTASYDSARNLSSQAVYAAFDFNSHGATYRLAFSHLDTGEPAGHYPPQGFLESYPTAVAFVDDQTMVYQEQGPSGTNAAVIVRPWQTAIEWYP